MKKTLTALAAAATIGLATVAAPTSASAGFRGGFHHHHSGAGIAAGVIGGLAAGALIGSAVGAPYYAGYPYGAYAYTPAYGPDCFLRRERFWDGFGWRIRNVRVCY